MSLLLALWPTYAHAQPPVRDYVIGLSTRGAPINAVAIGSGPRKLLLVGDTHGGPEANTFFLAQQLADHFRANPQDVPDLVTLVIVPTLNPDGLAAGSRFNANFVDLNRNMDTDFDACPENDWRITVFGAGGLISDTGGPFANSEPESRVLTNLLLDASAAILYHSNAGSVFPAFCEHAPSILLAERYAAAANYEYTRFWQRYPITGGAHDHAAALGVAAIIPELITATDSEFAQNLAAVQAVLADAETLLPPVQDAVIGETPVPAPIWRYWRAHGGANAFGEPLGAASIEAGVVQQYFENALITWRPGSEPPAAGPALLGGPTDPPGAPCGANEPDCRYFDQSGHAVRAGFLQTWERAGGLEALGLPLSGEFRGRAFDGTWRTLQHFERATLSYTPAQGVRHEPLGTATLLRTRFDALVGRHGVR